MKPHLLWWGWASYGVVRMPPEQLRGLVLLRPQDFDEYAVLVEPQHQSVGVADVDADEAVGGRVVGASSPVHLHRVHTLFDDFGRHDAGLVLRPGNERKGAEEHQYDGPGEPTIHGVFDGVNHSHDVSP